MIIVVILKDTNPDQSTKETHTVMSGGIPYAELHCPLLMAPGHITLLVH
jgi:hypothetical protein